MLTCGTVYVLTIRNAFNGKAHLVAKGDSPNVELKHDDKPLAKHLRDESVSEEEFKIRNYFHFIKTKNYQRIGQMTKYHLYIRDSLPS